MIASTGAGLRPVRRSSSVRVLVVLGVLFAVVPACGKKGPPLPPLINRPRAPEGVSARRLGDEVQIRFTVPRVNQSGVQPANIVRVDLYAVTGPKLDARGFLEHATVIASVPVNRPPPPEEEASRTSREPANPVAVEQGAQAVVTEALTPQALQPIQLSEKESRPRQRTTINVVVVRRSELAPPDVATPVTSPLLRHYAVVGIAKGGGRGAMSSQVSVSLGAVPSPPPQPSAAVRERGVELAWEAPPTFRGLTEEPRDDEAPSSGQREDGDDDDRHEPAAGRTEASPPRTVRALRSRSYLPWPLVRSGFNVYAVPAGPAELSDASPYAVSRLPQLLTPRPLTVMQFTDGNVQFGQERCYVVRTVEMTGATAVESAPSPATCVKAADVFPPSAPRSLAAVAAESSINLIWEPNTERDLAGYLVLRSAEGAPLEPVFTDPIRETTWRDTPVKSGVKYRYAVVAVDSASPANRSAPSNEVEVFIR